MSQAKQKRFTNIEKDTLYYHGYPVDDRNGPEWRVSGTPIVFVLDRITPNGTTAVFNLKEQFKKMDEELVGELSLPEILDRIEHRAFPTIPRKIDFDEHAISLRRDVNNSDFLCTGWDRGRREMEIEWRKVFAWFYAEARIIEKSVEGKVSLHHSCLTTVE